MSAINRAHNRQVFQWIPPNPKRTHVIPLETRKLGIVIIGGKGTGKSRVTAREILHQDFWQGVPSVVIDPLGTISDEFLDKVLRTLHALRRQRALSSEEERLIWQRIRYIDMSGRNGLVTKWPIYQKQPDQSYSDASADFISILEMLDPELQKAPRSGRNAVIEIGKPVGILMTALGLGVTEAQEMLTLPKKEFLKRWEKPLQDLRAETSAREVRQAVDFMLHKYAKLDANHTERVTSAFLTKLSLFDDDTVVAMYSAAEPSIDWQAVVNGRQTILLDFRNETNPLKRRFKLLHVFISFRNYLIRRELRQTRPVAIIVDELAELYGLDEQAENRVFGTEIVKLVDQYARNKNCWPTLMLQHPAQVDERSLQSLLSCGTIVVGDIANYDQAEMLAKTFYAIDPHLVKRYHYTYLQVGGTFQHILSDRLRYTSPPVYEMVPTNPVEYTPQEQIMLLAKQFMTLGRFRFLVKIPKLEGDRSGVMKLADFNNWDREVWVDKPAVATLRQHLLQQAGLPIEEVLAEIEARGRVPRKPVVTQDKLELSEEETEAFAPAAPAAIPPPAGLSAQAALALFDQAFAEVQALPPDTWQLP